MLLRRELTTVFIVLVVSVVMVLSIWRVVGDQPVRAQHVVDDALDAMGYEALTVTSSATPFTAATAANARAATCTLEGTATLRYRYDGTDPTSTEGHLMTTPSATAPVPLTILGRNNVNRFRAIATAGNATLRCTYLR